MGVYIKGIEMPKSCRECPLATRFFDGEDVCAMLGTYVHDRDREDDCPLVPVPPHGRLIDADAMFKDICDSINEMTAIGLAVDGQWLWGKLNDALENAPTIIPPSEEGE